MKANSVHARGKQRGRAPCQALNSLSQQRRAALRFPRSISHSPCQLIIKQSISIRCNAIWVNNHWPEPHTNLRWSPGWFSSQFGRVVGQKMAAGEPVPAQGWTEVRRRLTETPSGHIVLFFERKWQTCRSPFGCAWYSNAMLMKL